MKKRCTRLLLPNVQRSGKFITCQQLLYFYIKGIQMETKRFKKNDDGFICANCGKDVPPLKYTSRNHCPHCLSSLHLDVNPGDRASDCKGIMDAVTAEPDPKKGFIITHRCRKCGALKRNKAADDDNRKKIIELTACQI